MEDFTVSSEIFAERSYPGASGPKIDAKNVVTAFKFSRPPALPETDPDGDYVLDRQREEGSIEIEHVRSTKLELVGEQLWRGAFLLADWVLHNGQSFAKGHKILELGSGVGLTSIIASIFSEVVCTDVDKGDILRLIRSNVDRNKSAANHDVFVAELDFLSGKVDEQLLSGVKIILAADVVYDDRITEAFVNTLKRLLKFKDRIAIVALEKRFVFTLADCDTVAPCFEFFLRCLNTWKEVDGTLRVEYLSQDFPKYFDYERVKELVLMKISQV